MNSPLGRDAILIETICQTMPDPIFIIDKKGAYVDVFGGNVRILYDSGDYLKKKRLHDILPVDIADRFISIIKKAIDTNALQLIEYELTSVDMRFNPMDGPTRPQWYEGRVFPFRLPPAGEPFVIWIAINITEKKTAQIERDRVNQELKKAIEEIKTLRGILPICSFCKKIRDDKGYWNQIESYITKHSEADFSHSICPECAKKHYPDYDIYGDKKS